MMELHKHHFNNDDIDIRKKISRVNHLISQHEEEVANPILNYITSREDLKLIGKKKIENKNRAPTISITNKKISSKQMSKILVNNNIATRNDNFYAWRCLEALNINTDDGLVRLSLTHYNNLKDSEKVIEALKKV